MKLIFCDMRQPTSLPYAWPRSQLYLGGIELLANLL
jgi:hypothetical protein